MRGHYTARCVTIYSLFGSPWHDSLLSEGFFTMARRRASCRRMWALRSSRRVAVKLSSTPLCIGPIKQNHKTNVLGVHTRGLSLAPSLRLKIGCNCCIPDAVQCCNIPKYEPSKTRTQIYAVLAKKYPCSFGLAGCHLMAFAS